MMWLLVVLSGFHFLEADRRGAREVPHHFDHPDGGPIRLAMRNGPTVDE
jgi:hypothetical protein